MLVDLVILFSPSQYWHYIVNMVYIHINILVFADLSTATSKATLKTLIGNDPSKLNSHSYRRNSDNTHSSVNTKPNICRRYLEQKLHNILQYKNNNNKCLKKKSRGLVFRSADQDYTTQSTEGSGHNYLLVLLFNLYECVFLFFYIYPCE